MERSADESVGFKTSLLEQHSVSPARVLAPIVCDEMSFAPPKGLLIAGFSWAARKSDSEEAGWEIDENLVDTVVAWSALGAAAKHPDEKIDCVLEINFRDELPEADVVHMAASGEFSISLVGLSSDPTHEDAQIYVEKLSALAKAMLRSANFSKSFYPFSNEFEAYFLSRLGKTADAEKMRNNWSHGLVDIKHVSGARAEYALSRTALGRMDVRAACENALLEHFGSQELVDAAIMALAKPIAKRVGRFVDEVKAQPKAKQERFDLTGSSAR